jgi:hypothetical protein
MLRAQLDGFKTQFAPFVSGDLAALAAKAAKMGWVVTVMVLGDGTGDCVGIISPAHAMLRMPVLRRLRNARGQERASLLKTLRELLAISFGAALMPLGEHAKATMRCTADGYGTSTYTRCSDGTRGSADRIGTSIYARDGADHRHVRHSDRTRATIDRCGNKITYRNNRGTRGTIETYGGTTTQRETRGARMTMKDD